MNSAIYDLLLVARVIVHDTIDKAAAQAVADIARQVTSARRAIGQRIRKLNRDLQNDQNT
jgi:hypothetical protein